MFKITKIAISLLLLLYLISSCKKKQVDIEPVVHINSPESQAVFFVPNSIDISFSVEHGLPLEYIRVSIDNKNMTPVSGQQFYYPESNNYRADISIPVDYIPSNIELPPFYLHIVVSDFNEVTHTYLELSLHNSTMDYKGCFVIGNNGLNMLIVNYYNSLFVKEFGFEISGNYSDSDISATSNKIYIATNTPDKIRAYNTESGEHSWTKDPQLPYPGFNKVVVDNNMIYSSTDIGRIIGLSANEGNQLTITPVLPDSIPINVCVTDKYFISDFIFRDSGTKFWASFYRETGIKYQLFITGLETIALFSNANKNEVTAFCNSVSSGKVIIYDVETNSVIEQITLDNKLITKICKIDNNNFLFSSNSLVYHFNLQNQSYLNVYEGDNNMIDIKYNSINNHLFLVYPNKIEILSYPQYNNLATVKMPYLIEAIELLYGF